MKDQTESSCVISIRITRPMLKLFSTSCACGTCGHVMSITCEVKGDGILELASTERLGPFERSPFKQVLVQTESGKLSILCAACRSGVTSITLSSENAGISFSKERSRCKEDQELVDAGFPENPEEVETQDDYMNGVS